MRRRVQRWGNSLAVRIPSEIAKACAVCEGTELSVRSDGTEIVLTPEPERKRYALAALVRGITKRNRHHAVESRGSVGKEAW
jgi:antitoxin MazE